MLNFKRNNILLLLLGLLLLYSKTDAFEQGWYGYIGAGLGDRKELYTLAEKQWLEEIGGLQMITLWYSRSSFWKKVVNNTILEGLGKGRAEGEKAFKSTLQDEFESNCSAFFKFENKEASALAALSQIGLGYQFSPHLALEGGGIGLWSKILSCKDAEVIEGSKTLALLKSQKGSKTLSGQGFSLVGKIMQPFNQF